MKKDLDIYYVTSAFDYEQGEVIDFYEMEVIRPVDQERVSALQNALKKAVTNVDKI